MRVGLFSDAEFFTRVCVGVGGCSGGSPVVGLVDLGF